MEKNIPKTKTIQQSFKKDKDCGYGSNTQQVHQETLLKIL